MDPTAADIRGEKEAAPIGYIAEVHSHDGVVSTLTSMKTFVLHLQDAQQYERMEGVSSFVGEDDSGCFGILAGHCPMMTSLVFGLARFRVGEEDWQYLALPRALVYFIDNELFLSTRRYVRDNDYERISDALHAQLEKEEATLETVRGSLRHMEEEMLKRLWEMGRDGKKSP